MPEKSKPPERAGRKATGLFPGKARIGQQGCQATPARCPCGAPPGCRFHTEVISACTALTRLFPFLSGCCLQRSWWFFSSHPGMPGRRF